MVHRYKFDELWNFSHILLDKRATERGIRMEKIVYTVKEISNLLGIGLPAAYQLVRSDGFPCIKVGKRLVVPIVAFHTWVKEQTNTTSSYFGGC